MLGTSFGGLVSLLGAYLDPRIKALVLKSPVTEPISFWEDRLSDEQFQQWREEGVLHYDDFGEKFDLNFEYWQDLQQYDLLNATKKPTCPVLIVHGDSDTVVPISQSEILANSLSTEVTRVVGADHFYSQPAQKEECLTLMVDFLASILN